MIRGLSWFFFTTITGCLSAQPAFQNQTLNITPPIEPRSTLEWLDVEGDGDMDFLAFYPAAAGQPYNVRLYNNNNLVFTGVDNPVSNGNISATAFYVADGDQDNDADFLYLENRKIFIARNNGDLSFTKQSTGIEVTWDGADLYWVDWDGDHDPDIITEFASTGFTVVPNLGDGTFVGQLAYGTDDFTTMSFADINNDGVVNNLSLINGFVHLGNGFPPYGFNSEARFLWTDIDNDKDIDLWGYTGSGQWVLFKNRFTETGQTSFSGETSSVLMGATAADVGDINSDGLPDLIISGNSQTVAYINESTASTVQFQTVDLNIMPKAFTVIKLLDADDQEGLDLVFKTENADGTGSIFELYKNTLSGLSTPPPVPSGLTATIPSIGRLRLSWTGGDHAKNAYRLEVLKNGVPYVGSDSRSDGKLRRAWRAPGILHNTIELSNIAAGTYSWRVQAVDASQRASAFSASNQITVPISDVYQFNPTALTTAPVDEQARMEWIDVEGDDDMDFLAFYPSPDVAGAYRVKLYENVAQSFQLVNNFLSGGTVIEATAYAIGDANHDNHPDFMFIENRSIKIAVNNGDKKFTIDDIDITLDWDNASLQWMDMDRDGDLDILTEPTNNGYVLLLNQEKTGPSDGVAYPPNFDTMSPADLNNDGQMDFFMVSGANGVVIQSLSLTTGNFIPITGVTFPPKPGTVWFDADNDGDVDLLAFSTNGWRLFRNQFIPSGEVSLVPSAFLSGSVWSLSVADFNSDGLPDLATFDNGVVIYYNHSNASDLNFVRTVGSGSYFSGNSLASALDFDDQKGLDIVSPYVVYRNSLPTLSQPPPAPTEPAGHHPGYLYFMWQSAGAGLNYRLEVLKNGQPYLSSLSNPNGKLRTLSVPSPLLTPGKVLANATAGTYTWRVRAVDASFRTSPFSDIVTVNGGTNNNNPITGIVDYEVIGPLTVSPNPASDHILVDAPLGGSIVIRNSIGQNMFTTHAEEKISILVSTGSWATGLYIIEFDGGGFSAKEKILIIR